MYSSSAIKNESNTQASWAAAPSSSSGAVSPSRAHIEGLEDALSHRNVTFVFVIAVAVSLGVFIATYCIAYIIWCMILRQGGGRNIGRTDLYAYRAHGGGGAAAERNIVHGGLEASLVRSLPILRYSAGGDATEENISTKEACHVQSQECAVCLSEFEAGEEMKVLPVCGHGFHAACIDRWLVCRSTCPICRLSLLKLRTSGSHGTNSI